MTLPDPERPRRVIVTVRVLFIFFGRQTNPFYRLWCETACGGERITTGNLGSTISSYLYIKYNHFYVYVCSMMLLIFDEDNSARTMVCRVRAQLDRCRLHPRAKLSWVIMAFPDF